MLTRMQKNWFTHTMLVGMLNGIATLENRLVVSFKSKRVLPIWLSSCTPEDLPQRNENLCSCRNLYMTVHSSLIHNSPNLESIQFSFDGWMDKQTGISMPKKVLSNRRNKISINATTWMKLGNNDEWKKKVTYWVIAFT